MIKIFTDALSYFKKEYRYPDDTVIYEQYTNIDEMIASLTPNDVALFDISNRLGESSQEVSLSIARIYNSGAHLLIDMDPLLSSVKMKIIGYASDNTVIFDLQLDESVRNTLAPFAWLTVQPFEPREQDLIVRDDKWYWDFVLGKTSYASAQAALNSVTYKFGIPDISLAHGCKLYEKSSQYFKRLCSESRNLIITPRKNVNYDYLEELLLNYKNSGVTFDMFTELQMFYKTGVIDTWRLIYGYVSNAHEQDIIAKYPSMADSHIISNLYNIHDTLCEKHDLYAGFGISHLKEFWH
jgi:hypothetical protein